MKKGYFKISEYGLCKLVENDIHHPLSVRWVYRNKMSHLLNPTSLNNMVNDYVIKNGLIEDLKKLNLEHSLKLAILEEKLDNALSKETTESLTEYLNTKRKC